MEHFDNAMQEMVDGTGLSSRQLAARAGVSSSTLSRVLHGSTDPTVGTLRDIAMACGFDLDIAVRPISDPKAAHAVRGLLENGYPSNHADWESRIARFSNEDSPVGMVKVAATCSAPLCRKEARLFSGRISMGHLSSVCDSTNGACVVSGAAGLVLPDTYGEAPAVTILWTENVSHTSQLAADSMLHASNSRGDATVAVIKADSELFTNSFRHGLVPYAAPLQIMVDCIAQGGSIAELALKEILSW